jgi:hypothetical protein
MMGCLCCKHCSYEEYKEPPAASTALQDVLDDALRVWLSPTAAIYAPRASHYTLHFSCASTTGARSAAIRNRIPEAATYHRLPPYNKIKRVSELLTTQLAGELPYPTLSPVAHTLAKHFVTQEAAKILARLVNPGDNFRGHHIGHSFIMCGPRGSGKTLALQRLSTTAGIVFPCGVC